LGKLLMVSSEQLLFCIEILNKDIKDILEIEILPLKIKCRKEHISETDDEFFV